MEIKSKTITYNNYNEIIDNDIEEIFIQNGINISKLNLPYSVKFLNIERLRNPLLNLPFSLEKITINKGCKCCIDKSKIPFNCEINIIKEEAHDYVDPFIYGTNYNILRIMSGMSGLTYSN